LVFNYRIVRRKAIDWFSSLIEKNILSCTLHHHSETNQSTKDQEERALRGEYRTGSGLSHGGLSKKLERKINDEETKSSATIATKAFIIIINKDSIVRLYKIANPNILFGHRIIDKESVCDSIFSGGCSRQS